MAETRVMTFEHCNHCPFGVIKNALSDKKMLVCRHPGMKKEMVLAKGDIDKKMVEPPDFCMMIGLEEFVQRNRHEIIKMIEKVYGPLHIDPFPWVKKKEKPITTKPYRPWTSKDGKMWTTHWESQQSPRIRAADKDWSKLYQRRYWALKLQEYDKNKKRRKKT